MTYCTVIPYQLCSVYWRFSRGGGGGFINITNQPSFRFQSTLDLIAWLTLFHIYNVSIALLEKKKKHTFRCSRDDVRMKGKCT